MYCTSSREFHFDRHPADKVQVEVSESRADARMSARVGCLRVLQGDGAFLTWQRAFFKLDLLHVLSRHNNQTYVAAVPCHAGRWITGLFNSLADSFSGWCTILVGKCKDDVAVLGLSARHHEGI